MTARRKKASPDHAVVTIEGEEARAVLPEGPTGTMKVEELVARLQPGMPDSCGAMLPDGVKCLLPASFGFVLVHQTPPSVFSFRWIARGSKSAYGPGTEYRTIKIALPYLIVLAVFERARGQIPRLSSKNECFFSTAPLDAQGLDTQLCFPALLNCSKFPDDGKHPLSWICTQHLESGEFASPPSVDRSVRDGLRALLRHLLESGFNRSSEDHELSSWFSESVEAGIDPRIASVEDWEKATAEDPLFVLDVPWLPTGLSLGAIAGRITSRAARTAVTSSDDVARVMLNTRRRRAS
jgi:hypothetical protein